jgi:hypothetical protein
MFPVYCNKYALFFSKDQLLCSHDQILRMKLVIIVGRGERKLLVSGSIIGACFWWCLLLLFAACSLFLKLGIVDVQVGKIIHSARERADVKVSLSIMSCISCRSTRSDHESHFCFLSMMLQTFKLQ